MAAVADHQHIDDGSSLLDVFVALLLAVTFLVSAMLITIGMLLPAFHIQTFWVFNRDVSIFYGISELARGGQRYLGWLLFLVSVLVPIAKSLTGLFIAMNMQRGPVVSGIVGTFEFLGKLSFSDVFVVALIVIILDGRLLTTANIGPGIHAYATGVALSWLGTGLLGISVRRKRR